MRQSTALLAGGVIVIAALATWWVSRPPTQAGRADAGNSSQVTLGASVYRDHCAICHGANLEGQPEWKSRKPDGRLPAPPHDQTGHTWHHSDDILFRITKGGLNPPLAPAGYQSDMPAFGGVLTDEQIWAVLAYIKSRWPQDIQARQSTFNK